MTQKQRVNCGSLYHHPIVRALSRPRELPLEWESRAEEEELEINVEDLTEELYVPRKKAFHAFSGHGYRLGR